MDEPILNNDTQEIMEDLQEIKAEDIQDEKVHQESTENVQPFEMDSSFSPPIVQIEGVNYSYYEVAYKEQIKTNALLMTILIAYVTIFVCTRFYRWFRSIFTITI